MNEGIAIIKETVRSCDPMTIPDGVKPRFDALHWDMKSKFKPPTNNNPQPQNSGGRQSPNPQQQQNTGGRQSPNPQQNTNNNPVNVVNNIMSGGGNHPPNPQQNSGGRQSPNPQQNSGGRQSPNPPTNNNTNLRRLSNN